MMLSTLLLLRLTDLTRTAEMVLQQPVLDEKSARDVHLSIETIGKAYVVKRLDAYSAGRIM